MRFQVGDDTHNLQHRLACWLIVRLMGGILAVQLFPPVRAFLSTSWDPAIRHAAAAKTSEKPLDKAGTANAGTGL
jgi:hypothetical protein